MDQRTFHEFQWLNESKTAFAEDSLVIDAPARSDYFFGRFIQSASDGMDGVSYNAPFYYTKVAGDFVMRVQVAHDFADTFDAASIMIMQDLLVWAKACFEKTDFDTHAVVSVVTNHISDDANGCNIEGNTVWLQAARAGNSFAFHYSQDGVRFYMMRTFSLPVAPEIMVGLVAQAPIGNGGVRIFKNFSLARKTVRNLRAGE